MKKVTLYAMLIICFAALAGCKKKQVVITVDDMQVNTILVKEDGSAQAVTVEEFDKNYYSLTELETFIKEKINQYNKEAGEEGITFESLEKKNSDAVLILNYSTVEHYSKFNEVDITFATTEQARSGELSMPDVFISNSDGSYVSQEMALKNDKYKVLIISENIDVIVQGSIKYYTNAVLVNSSKVQTSVEGEAVVVYKP